MIVTRYYWGMDLSIPVTFLKIMISGTQNPIKLIFKSISSNRPTSIILSSIFFMLEGDEKSFHEDYVQIPMVSLIFMEE